jgi:hypothetical protein
MFRIALAVIALRVLDDNFIQPTAGTSPADHLVSGLAEEIDTEGLSATDRLMARPMYGLRDATVAVISGHAPPKHLKTLVPRIAPRPLLLIADPRSPNGENLNRLYYRAAREPKTLWEIPGSGHVNGIAARPQEYERRVVEFFDRAL